MTAPPAPLWRRALACLPRPARRAPFVRIPLLDVVERQHRNRVLRDPRRAILGCSTFAELSSVALVLRDRGVEWRSVVGPDVADAITARLAAEMRDDG